jgi:VanZ family protein
MRMPPPRRLDLWLPPLVLMGIIFVLSSQPSLDTGLGLIDTIGRKLVHFGEYALLAFVVASAYAATDELHQSFVDGRHGTPLDWAIDSAGAALAAHRLLARQRIPA